MTIKSILTSLVLAAGLTAQVTREHSVVLKNWPAPLYWQPTQGETASTRAKGQAPQATPAVELIFVAMTPCRVVDTRASQMFPAPFGAPGLTPGPARSFPIQSSTLCSIPATAQAYSFTVTVVPPGVLGFLTIYPHGQPQPNAVTLDDVLGTIVNNAAIVPAGTVNGSVDAVVNGNTDLVIDINGYYAVPNPTVNTAYGLNALAGNTSGTNNTANGYGALFDNTTGSYNTASGSLALDSNTSGSFNTATGHEALFGNTTGVQNTATGVSTLLSNTTGGSNTATGYSALVNNITGSFNVASGTFALGNNTGGFYNTASGGYGALFSNTTGNSNVATGYTALFSNTTGSGNTATGASALNSNTTGHNNAASGTEALNRNTTGAGNNATGFDSLYNNTTGSGNVAEGLDALSGNVTGNENIAIGDSAGINITGSNNIDIGHAGVSTDSGAIRIGTGGTHTSFGVAGVYGVTTAINNAIAVLIDPSGQLGTQSSSRRFKENIEDMSDASSGLLRLRPVTFNYRRPYADGSKPLDYGLIAEEVAEVYPDLVVKGADGQIETVQYQKLTPMLLNELQKQQAQIAALQKLVETLITDKARAPITKDPR